MKWKYDEMREKFAAIEIVCIWLALNVADSKNSGMWIWKKYKNSSGHVCGMRTSKVMYLWIFSATYVQ